MALFARRAGHPVREERQAERRKKSSWSFLDNGETQEFRVTGFLGAADGTGRAREEPASAARGRSRLHAHDPPVRDDHARVPVDGPVADVHRGARDDEPAILRMYIDLLTEAGLEVHTAPTIDAAVTALDEGDWSVVLLDQRLHGFSWITGVNGIGQHHMIAEGLGKVEFLNS